MRKNSRPYIFVVGNEKGGAGKTTLAMHLITGLIDKGYNVASIDTDSRQQSLSNYLKNRLAYNKKNKLSEVSMPLHFHLPESSARDIETIEKDHRENFEQALSQSQSYADYIIIDTPGTHSFLSKLSHSYADTIITPMNDSFLDLDIMAKVNPDDLSVISPSIYSQMIWEQKMVQAAREKKSIEWVVVRNRLSNIDAINKRNVSGVLEELSKRISFKIAPGFSERVIFRELFLQGLTLIDLTKINYDKPFNLSHIAARQELRNFFSYLGVE